MVGEEAGEEFSSLESVTTPGKASVRSEGFSQQHESRTVTDREPKIPRSFKLG